MLGQQVTHGNRVGHCVGTQPERRNSPMKWFKRIGQFTIEMCKTWGALVTGGFGIGLLVWGLTGHWGG